MRRLWRRWSRPAGKRGGSWPGCRAGPAATTLPSPVTCPAACSSFPVWAASATRRRRPRRTSTSSLARGRCSAGYGRPRRGESSRTALEVLLPESLDEALAIKADRQEAIPLAGGTDLMVDLNFGRLRPSAIVDLSRVSELAIIRQENGHVFLGAGVTYATIGREMPAFKPLLQAARSVGSPQIRNRGTVGGNLGTASPAGDALPVLAAYDADVILRSRARGERSLSWHAFISGPKKTAIAPDELIIGARSRL